MTIGGTNPIATGGKLEVLFLKKALEAQGGAAAKLLETLPRPQSPGKGSIVDTDL